ncbi:MAG: nitroreductase family protein [Antricoccus sp.]
MTDDDYPFDLAVTDKLLTTTRSVRKRLDLDRPVPRKVILDCINIAQQAPTGGNKQKWHWLVVTDPAKKLLIAEVYRDVSQDYFASQDLSEARDPQQSRRVRTSSSYLRDNLEKVPAMVIPCVAGRPEDLAFGNQTSFWGSIIPATWSFMLALRSRGLGSVYTTLHTHDERRVAEALGIPASFTQTALIPLAYTKGTDFKAVARPPVEEIVSFDTWSLS